MQFYAIAYSEVKNSGHQGSLNHDLAIPVQRSNQLSYEATDAGNSFDRLIEPTNREILRVFWDVVEFNFPELRVVQY